MWLEAAGLAAAVGGMALAVRHPRSEFFGASEWQGPRTGNRIALTFDDGPSESTGMLLDLLEEYGAKATFFQVGVHVRRLPEVARQVVERGHEIGNHTEHHARLWTLGRAGIEREVGEAQEAIEEATGVKARWFRAPYGVRWFGLREAQEAHGLTGVMWSVLGHDWSEPAGHVAARLDAGLRPGAILCLHDGRELRESPEIGSTLEATRWILGQARNRGFEFVTLTELLCPMLCPPTLPTESGK
jgi:peptidoglycan/xylan/chitin deacetylase (PgdA/CDA1 family)